MAALWTERVGLQFLHVVCPISKDLYRIGRGRRRGASKRTCNGLRVPAHGKRDFRVRGSDGPGKPPGEIGLLPLATGGDLRPVPPALGSHGCGLITDEPFVAPDKC